MVRGTCLLASANAAKAFARSSTTLLRSPSESAACGRVRSMASQASSGVCLVAHARAGATAHTASATAATNFLVVRVVVMTHLITIIAARAEGRTKGVTGTATDSFILASLAHFLWLVAFPPATVQKPRARI